MEGGRESLRRQHECNRRDLLVLVHRYLSEEGMAEAADALRDETAWQVNLDEYQVCDNVDLSLVLMDFQAFYQMRFHRKPKLTKRADGGEETKPKKKSANNKANSSRKPIGCLVDDNENPTDLTLVGNGQQPASEEGEDGRPPVVSVPRELVSNPEFGDLAVQVAREFVDPSRVSRVSFDDVVGHSEVKRALEEVAVLPLRHPELMRECGLGANATTCLLLSGPPGTGKTMLARCIASSLKLPFLNLRPSTLASRWRGESEKLARCAFELARHNAPSVVFVDEVDAVLGGRHDDHEASRRCKSEFLVQLDGLLSGEGRRDGGAEGPVLFVAATNSVSSIDPALLRRFQRIFQLGLPSEKERFSMLKSSFAGTRLAADADLSAISAGTEGFSGSDLNRLVVEAKRMLFRLRVEEQENKGGERRGKEESASHLSREMLLEALERVRPARSVKDLKRRP